MLYFKNTELAEKYHVSLRTVLNWVEAAKQGKLALELYTQDDKSYVANSPKNVTVIEKMVEDRRKYRNGRGFKVITPKPELYELFSKKQLFDIISDLEVRHETQCQYSYFDEGANKWDELAERQATEDVPNYLRSTVKLIEVNQSYIDEILFPYKRVNVVDIGVGNAMPIKPLLEHLLAQGKLGRYIALDMSPQMLEIAGANIKKWFGNKVHYEGRQVDINYDRFAHLLADEYMQEDAESTINVVTAFGGTLTNLSSPERALKVIQSSMGRRDLFMYTLKLDTERSRNYFSHLGPNDSSSKAQSFPSLHRLLLDLFNISEEYYDPDMGYDPQKHMRYLYARLKVAISIHFDFGPGEQRIVELNKGDSILVWRHWHQSTNDVIAQVTNAGFGVLQTSLIENQEYMLTIARVQTED
jgi:uncharacterized SAM-dependent methyltransferase